MELTSNQTAQLTKRYLELLDSCGVIKNGNLDFAALWDKCAPLVNEVNKLRGIKDLISPSELKLSIGDRFNNHRSRFSDINDFDLADKMSSTEKQDSAENFVKFIEGLPYEHLFYFRIPIRLPEKLSSICVEKNFYIARLSEFEIDALATKATSNRIVDALLGLPSFKASSEDVFARIKISGYGSEVQGRAISCLKQFLYLGESSQLLIKTWDRRNPSLFENSKFVFDNNNAKKVMPFAVSNELAAYISSIKLNDQEFESYIAPSENAPTKSLLGSIFSPKNFEDYFKSQFMKGNYNFVRLRDESKAADRHHITSAIEWGFDGSANSNDTMGFIQTCIGLEALLGDKDQGGQKSLTEKLADRSAYLLCKTPIERKQHSDDFKKIYDLRSRLVHGDSIKLKDDQYKLKSDAQFLLKRLIYKELSLSGQN